MMFFYWEALRDNISDTLLGLKYYSGVLSLFWTRYFFEISWQS